MGVVKAGNGLLALMISAGCICAAFFLAVSLFPGPAHGQNAVSAGDAMAAALRLADSISVVSAGEVLDLDRCVAIAVRNHPGIVGASWSEAASRARVQEARAGYYPKVNASFACTRGHLADDDRRENDPGEYESILSLSQTVCDFGRTSAAVKVRSLDARASHADLRDTARQVVFDVQKAYYAELQEKQRLDAHAEEVGQLRLHLVQARRFHDAGVRPKIDVTTAEVNLGQAQLDLLRSENAVALARISLNNAMGMPDAPAYQLMDEPMPGETGDSRLDDLRRLEDGPMPGESGTAPGATLQREYAAGADSNPAPKSIIALDAPLGRGCGPGGDSNPPPGQVISLDAALERGYENRPDLLSAQARKEAARHSVDQVRSEYWPVLSGSASYGFASGGFPLDSEWSVGSTLSFPVFSGFLTRSQVAEARAVAQAARADEALVRQNIRFDIEQAYRTLESAAQQVALARLTRGRARENRELAVSRYAAGVGSAVEVADAVSSETNAKTAYFTALYDYRVAVADLERSTGGLLPPISNRTAPR